MTSVSKLISRDELIRKHPAFGERRYRIDYLIRTRQIPIIKLGRRIYFDERSIQEYISQHKIPEV